MLTLAIIPFMRFPCFLFDNNNYKEVEKRFSRLELPELLENRTGTLVESSSLEELENSIKSYLLNNAAFSIPGIFQWHIAALSEAYFYIGFSKSFLQHLNRIFLPLGASIQQLYE